MTSETGYAVEEIRLHNIRSYEGTHAISFPLGTTVITGGTGEGKSGLISGFKWCVRGMEGVPGKRKDYIPFTGISKEDNCWAEVVFNFGGKPCRIGREMWRDPETGRFRENLTLREGDVVLGGMEAQRRIDELILPDRLDLLIIEGRNLATKMRSLRKRRCAVDTALGKPDLVRGRDLARRVQPFFDKTHQDEISALEAAEAHVDIDTQLFELAQKMEGLLNRSAGDHDSEFVKILHELGEVEKSEIPEPVVERLQKIEKDVTELRTKSGEWLQGLKAEVAGECRSLEERLADAEKKLEEGNREAIRWSRGLDIARRTEAAFGDIIKMLEEEKLGEINASINEIFSAVSSKPTFGEIRFTPDHELIVEEMGNEYPPDQVRPSSGEQDAIGLSFLFGLSRAACGADCLILDDPTIHFDEEYKKRFMVQLPKFGFRQVIIFTNDQDFKEVLGVAQILEVEMEDGRSIVKKVK